MLNVVATERISDDNLLTFGSLLEHIANLYTERAPKRPLSERVLPSVLKTISSNNLLYSLLGHRILHSLVDRCKNKLIFDSPRIFLRNSRYNLVLNQFSKADKALFQRYREALHKTTVDSMLTHGVHKYFDRECLTTTLSLFLDCIWRIPTSASLYSWWRSRAHTPRLPGCVFPWPSKTQPSIVKTYR